MDYGKPLLEHDAHTNPQRQFYEWFREAAAAGLRAPEAAALATASPQGAPSLRMVLVKRFDEKGFVFFTSYRSRKGLELEVNPQAALLFHWDPLGRQVRIEGPVERATAEQTAAYVRSRPRRSQLSALASPQSEVIDSRSALERRVADLEQSYAERQLPIPSTWGGFSLVPVTYEFWQQREDRLHDRLRYARDHRGRWKIERLAP